MRRFEFDHVAHAAAAEASLTRRDRLPEVLEGIAAAAASPLRPLKLNAVAMRGVNDDEIIDLVQFAVDSGALMRFIEQMPLDAGHTWDREQMVTREEIVATLSSRWDLTPVPGRGGAPAEKWVLGGVENGGGPHEVGVIASVTATSLVLDSAPGALPGLDAPAARDFVAAVGTAPVSGLLPIVATPGGQ